MTHVINRGADKGGHPNARAEAFADEARRATASSEAAAKLRVSLSAKKAAEKVEVKPTVKRKSFSKKGLK